MMFTLQGFSHRNCVRVFHFLRVDSHALRTIFTVDVDLKSLAEFHITVQEAPLLCRQLLENRPEDDALRRFTLTRDDMHRIAAARLAVPARPKRKSATSKPAPIATNFMGAGVLTP
jgi:hypothetical protein